MSFKTRCMHLVFSFEAQLVGRGHVCPRKFVYGRGTEKFARPLNMAALSLEAEAKEWLSQNVNEASLSSEIGSRRLNVAAPCGSFYISPPENPGDPWVSFLRLIYSHCTLHVTVTLILDSLE